MLEGLVHRKQDHARLETSPASEYLGPFADALAGKGYCHRTIVREVFAGDRLSRWLRRRGQAAQRLDEAVFAEYLAELGRRRGDGRSDGRLPSTAAGARGFFEFLRHSGAITAPIAVAGTEAAQWLTSYDRQLDHVAGLSAGTRRCYCRYAGLLIAKRFGERTLDWTSLTADDLADFVEQVTGKLKPSSGRLPATATRGLVRFLVSPGVVRSGIEAAIPTVRRWKHASLPKAITPDEIEHILSLCESKTDLALRCGVRLNSRSTATRFATTPTASRRSSGTSPICGTSTRANASSALR